MRLLCSPAALHLQEIRRMDKRAEMREMHAALYQMALLQLAMSLPPDDKWAEGALSIARGDHDSSTPYEDTNWAAGALPQMELDSSLAFFTAISTPVLAAIAWKEIREHVLGSERKRVKAMVRHYHNGISLLERELGRHENMHDSWYPITEGAMQADLPSLALKTWVSDHGMTTITCQRRIVTAANRVYLKDGSVLVVPAARHFSHRMHCILDLLADNDLIDRKGRLGVPDNQGFIDQYDDYHSRRDAYIIAKAYNRVDDDRNGSDDELFSEGLH